MFNEKGQTLMELIVVTSVSVIIIGALVFATISSLRNAQFAKNQAQATKLAQEGIEQVRVGRDRNQCISNLDDSVNSWNGGNSACLHTGSIWNYQITGTISNCENLTNSSKCYFIVDTSGSLTLKGYSQTSFPTDFAQGIPAASPIFRRAVTLSDESANNLYKVQKKVTVIVRWTDFSGDHQSQLTTILRNLTQ